MSLPSDLSCTTSPETTFHSASAELSRPENLAPHEHGSQTTSHGLTASHSLTASHGLTASHALAQARADTLGETPDGTGEHTCDGNAIDADSAFQPHILGMSKDDAWVAIRRFNLLVFRVKASKNRPLTDFDIGSSEQAETSPEQLQAQLARLYMIVIIGLFAVYKHMVRLRSWREPQRTSKFLSVYLAAWLMNLLAPTLFLFIMLMVISPASRSLCFPHTPPSIVDAKTGEVQQASEGVMASETSVTGAPETHKGEAVEQEAHSFITSFSKVRVAPDCLCMKTLGANGSSSS